MSRAALLPSHHLVSHFFPVGDTVLPSPRPWLETQGDSRASHREQRTAIPDAKTLPYARRRRPLVRAEARSREPWSVSRCLGCARRCLGYQAPRVAALALGLRRPGCQITGKLAFSFYLTFRKTPYSPTRASTLSFGFVCLIFLNSTTLCLDLTAPAAPYCPRSGLRDHLSQEACPC